MMNMAYVKPVKATWARRGGYAVECRLGLELMLECPIELSIRVWSSERG